MGGTIAIVFSLIALIISFYVGNKTHRGLFLLSIALYAGGAVSLIVETTLRSIKIGFPALTGTYEAILFFSMIIFIVVFILKILKQSESVIRGALILIIALMLIASSPLFSDELNPPVPALRSHWLVLHVAFAFIGEAWFAAAFFASFIRMFKKSEDSCKKLDKLVYRSILTGYPFFTLGALVFGAIWASTAWGSFWSWDPKETWALITWLTYTWYLHARLVSRKSPKTTNLISLLGFLFTMITFFGVKYISLFSESLHLY